MTKRFLSIFVLLPTLLLVSSRIEGKELDESKIDALFSKWDQPESPGCAVGIVCEGELIYAKGFGSANLNYEIRNSPSTRFEIGSFSKAFTSLCIAMLMDDGRIQPDDDVRKYLPELQPLKKPAQIRHLLRCETGYWAQWHITKLAGWENLPVQTPYQESDLLAILEAQPELPIEPGSEFRYGSGDFFLLGLIVKRVSGKPLAQFAKERVFEPLGMHSTIFEVDSTQVLKNRAVGHIREKDGWHLWRSQGYLPGGAGVNTTVEDLARWNANFDNNQLGDGPLVTEFFQSGSVLGNRFCLDGDAYRKKLNPDLAEPAGQYRGLRRIQFTGGVFGMHSVLARFPDQEFTVICLSNADELTPSKLAREISDICLADHMSGEAHRAVEIIDAKVRLTAAQLDEKVGRFQSEEGIIFDISAKDGKLWNSNSRGETYELIPYSENRFQASAYPEDTFVFHPPSPGEPIQMSLEWRGGTIAFQRVGSSARSVSDLDQYVGSYFNEPLGSTYRFKIHKEGLWLRVNGHRWEQLEPTVADEFVPYRKSGHENRVLRFLRNDAGEVEGLSISFWRVRGVKFARVR